MARYRKKPIEVDAVQLRWDTWSEMCEHADVGSMADGKPQGCYVDKHGRASDTLVWINPNIQSAEIGLEIPTLEGVMLARQGDWVVRGAVGELYPVKPDAFEASFEPV